MTDAPAPSGQAPAAEQSSAQTAAPTPPPAPATQTAADAPGSPAAGTPAETQAHPQETPSTTAEGRTTPQLDDSSEPVDLEGWRRYTRRLSRENADRRKELQSVTAERDAAVSELSQLKTHALRVKVAADVGLRADLADRIRGDTEPAMREDAERLREMTDPVGNLGVRSGGTAAATAGGSMDQLLRQSAGRGRR